MINRFLHWSHFQDFYLVCLFSFQKHLWINRIEIYIINVPFWRTPFLHSESFRMLWSLCCLFVQFQIGIENIIFPVPGKECVIPDYGSHGHTKWANNSLLHLIKLHGLYIIPFGICTCSHELLGEWRIIALIYMEEVRTWLLNDFFCLPMEEEKSYSTNKVLVICFWPC